MGAPCYKWKGRMPIPAGRALPHRRPMAATFIDDTEADNAANGECFTQQSVSTAWDPTLEEVEELIDGLAEAGKGVAQKASECDCTVSLTC